MLVFRKSLTLLLLTFAFSLSVCAQTSFVEEQFNDEKIEGNFQQFFGEQDGFLYVIALSKKTWIVHKINANTLKPTEKWELDIFKFDGVKTEFIRATLGDNGFHLGFMAYDGLANEVTFLEVLVRQNGEIEEPRKLGVVDNVWSSDGIDMYTSRNHNLTCVKSQLNDELGVKLFVFEKDWDVALEKVVKNPFEETFTLVDVNVSNAGEVWLTGYREPEDNKIDNPKSSMGYAVIKVEDSSEDKIFDLKETGKLFVGVSVCLDIKKDTTLIHGFYPEDENSDYFNGLYQARLNEKDMVKYSDNYSSIEESFLSKLDENWKITRGSELGFMRPSKVQPFLGMSTFDILDTYLFEDGRIGLIAERHYYHRTSQYATIYPDEVLVMKLAPNGNPIWQKTISKKGSGYNSGFAMLHEGKDDVNIAFRGNINNLESMRASGPTTEDATIGKGGVFFISKVSSDGQVEIDTIPMYSKLRGWYYISGSSHQSISDKSVAFYLRYGRRNSFKLTRLSL